MSTVHSPLITDKINLGIAQTVCKELKTMRSIKVRYERYVKYANFHRLNLDPKVRKLINRLKVYDEILSGASCYTLPTTTYDKIRIKLSKLKNTEELWEHCTGRPWISLNQKPPNRLLRLRMEALKESKYKARNQELKWRLTQELQQRVAENFYIIFNTLTVDPASYRIVWSQGSKCWEKYINSIKQLCGPSPYFAVREAGELNGRLHIHSIHMLETMPASWKKDPNQGVLIPKNREITQMKKLWKYGFSQPIAVRFNSTDAFSRLGWRWPLDENDTPVETSNPFKMASYLAKYLTKSENKGVKKWKTKISRNLGLTPIRNYIKGMEDENLIFLAQLTTNQLITLGGYGIPKQILKKEAIREIMARMDQSRKIKNLTRMTPEPSIIMQWKDLIQKSPNIHSSRSTLFIETLTLKETAGCEIKRLIERFDGQIRNIYDPNRYPYVNHIIPTHRSPAYA